jgi:uncharacterized protein (DUF2141 family)
MIRACLFTLLFAMPAYGAELTVKISGLSPGKGAITVSVFDGQAAFLKEPAITETLPVGAASDIEIPFELPTGRYAISVTYDLNRNGKIDTNLLGIPTEPYGFSNNPSTLFGPPSFADAAIEHSGAGINIDIDLQTAE